MLLLAFAKLTMKIKGVWEAYTDDFVVRYNGEKRVGAIRYGNKIDKRGRLSASVWHDKDLDGKRDRGEGVIATYKADADYVSNELDYYSREDGIINIDKEKGRFTLYHHGEKYGSGKIRDMDYFFSKSKSKKTERKIKGIWEAYTDDFVIRYNGRKKVGAIRYGNKIDERGRLSATIWFDRRRNGKLDKGETVIATYKADSDYFSNELDYYSRESGKITIDRRNERFKLYHHGEKYGLGKIVDISFFLD